MDLSGLKYHHVGIPTKTPIEGEVYLKDYKVYHFGYEKSEFGIEENGAPIELIQIKK